MPGSAILTIRSKQWDVSLATTSWEMSQGLGGIVAIPPQTGMLFDLGAEQIISVTTVPMLFPLDIAFISEGLIITEVYHNVPPGYLVTSEMPARLFLEVNADELEDVEVGDFVSIDPLAYIVVQSDWFSTMVSVLGVIIVAAFLVGMVRMFTKKMLGKTEQELLPQVAPSEGGEKVYFIGSCKVSNRLCLTHGYSVSESVKCPQSPLTDEEWEAASELVKTAFPEGQHNPWVNGWWPETLEEAEGAAGKYETSLWGAFRKYEGTAREAVERYRRSAERAIYHYRQYVMREYKRGKEEALLPQTVSNPARLDGLEIVKAYKEISAHGEDKISVSLEAWAIFPRGRRPHFITMYRSEDEYVISPLYAHIGESVRVPAAKVKAWIKSLPVRHFEAMAVAPQFREAAERLAKQVDAAIAILPLPRQMPKSSPRLIGPTRREKEPAPEELEFFADSPDHIDHSMNHNGIRPKLDAVFQEAIARAKGGR